MSLGLRGAGLQACIVLLSAYVSASFSHDSAASSQLRSSLRGGPAWSDIGSEGSLSLRQHKADFASKGGAIAVTVDGEARSYGSSAAVSVVPSEPDLDTEVSFTQSGVEVQHLSDIPRSSSSEASQNSVVGSSIASSRSELPLDASAGSLHSAASATAPSASPASAMSSSPPAYSRSSMASVSHDVNPAKSHSSSRRSVPSSKLVDDYFSSSKKKWAASQEVKGETDDLAVEDVRQSPLYEGGEELQANQTLDKLPFEPSGVVSNVYGGSLTWWVHDKLSYKLLLGLSLICYPFIILMVFMGMMIVVSFCLVPSAEVTTEQLGMNIPLLKTEDLAPRSQVIYSWWVFFSFFMPLLFILGTCFLLALAMWRWPEESYVILMTFGSFYFFSLTIHQLSFVPFLWWEVAKRDEAQASDLITVDDETLTVHGQVRHWVILPNYLEDVEILEMTLESIAQSTIANRQISIVLAMEEREEGSAEKASMLLARWRSRFHDIMITMHPRNLPNDPPGKASNVAWAFKQLAARFASFAEDQMPEEAGHAQMVVLTIADADSCFHRLYFESLTKDFVEVDEIERTNKMWQAPIFHMKNYHSQPAPVVVGSIFTGLVEASNLADPNLVRFPYSTYSLPFTLASAVGGWDPQWIAEDWHMGIKCYMFMLGKMDVRTLPCPIVNYTPEDAAGSWWGTLWERLKQAKRHALGFSDLAYMFMTLPLIFQYLLRVDSRTENVSQIPRLFAKSFSCVVRLVNSHVFIGVLLLYSAAGLGVGSMLGFAFVKRGGGLAIVIALAGTVLFCTAAAMFSVMYQRLKYRLDPPAQAHRGMFGDPVYHFIYILMCIVFLGPVFFIAVAYCAWNAAYQCAFTAFKPQEGFKYDVAPKPTQKLSS